MAKYKTADDVKVTAEQKGQIWTITYPDGEVRECHDRVFTDNFEKV